METQANVDRIDVRYVAHLARLELTDGEAALYQEQLEHVLAYVRTLTELDVGNVEPTAHPSPVFNVFRDDTPAPSQPAEETFRNAPKTADGLFVMPRIIE